MNLEVTAAFPTPLGRLWVPDAEAMNQSLRSLILAQEAKYQSLGRSNISGWHSQTDLLDLPDPPWRRCLPGLLIESLTG